MIAWKSNWPPSLLDAVDDGQLGGSAARSPSSRRCVSIEEARVLERTLMLAARGFEQAHLGLAVGMSRVHVAHSWMMPRASAADDQRHIDATWVPTRRQQLEP
jgi:hypothetical protein